MWKGMVNWMFILKSIVIAFSMFSGIPVPQFEWKEREMKYMIAFFPLVGIVIGAVVFSWSLLCENKGISRGCFVLIGTALPILLSGGIHLDGYMDTMDALSSYQDKEKRLAILKDAHIGAFAVIGTLVYYFIYIGAYMEIEGKEAMVLVAAGFYLSRILSGISVVTFSCAKKDGLLYTFSGSAQKTAVRILLYLQLLLCGGIMIFFAGKIGVAALFACILLLFYYRQKCTKEFGGITGDTSGYFTLLCEIAIMLVASFGLGIK